MPVVLRGPFYAPSPGQDTFWEGRPRASAAIQIFVAGGQPPTKRWSYDHQHTEELWAWAFRRNFSTFFIPPVLPVPEYLWKFNLDADYIWDAKPLRSNAIFLLAGKPPTPRWEYDYSDQELWEGKPLRAYLPLVLLQKPFTERWAYDYSDQELWPGRPLRSYVLTSLASAGQPPTPRWRYTIDQEPFWQWQKPRNLILVVTPAGTRPPFLYTWKFDFDQSYSWAGQPQAIPLPIRVILPIPPPPAGGAKYRLLADHYLAIGYTEAGTTITEGIEVPVGWIPSEAVDPLNSLAIQAFWDIGPRGQKDAESSRDLWPLWWMRRAGQPVQPPSVYWKEVAGQPGQFVLTGAGAILGTRELIKNG